MSALDSARDHYLAACERFDAARGAEPSWLGSLRHEAIAAFAEQGFPSTKLEEWRYTSLKSLADVHFELAGGRGDGAAGSVSQEDVESLALPLFACSLFVFVDGHFDPELSATPALGGNLHVESLARLGREAPERIEPYLGRLACGKGHPFAALNTAFIDDGAAILVPPGAVRENPVHVVFVTTETDAASVCHPRVLISAGVNSQVTVIQDHVSIGDAPAFSNAVTEVHAQQGASVRLVLIQRESDATFHLSNLQARVERDARFSAHTITLGGRLVRNDAGVVLADEGADCTLNGLFLGSGRALLDNHTLVDHAMPHGTSRELYKGILGDHSKGGFRGRVIVRPDAQKTNAYQSNPNLLIGDGAEINTKPQLEIYADDVKCGHGSSIGSLDGDALFYLRSRGIGESRARDLLTQAFGAEILEALPVPALAEELAGELLDRIHGARALEETP